MVTKTGLITVLVAVITVVFVTVFICFSIQQWVPVTVVELRQVLVVIVV